MGGKYEWGLETDGCSTESLKENRAFTASDEHGVFRFEQVRPGEKLLLVSHPSYNKTYQYFDLPKSGQDTPMLVILYP